jgi:hypothetical protein
MKPKVGSGQGITGMLDTANQRQEDGLFTAPEKARPGRIMTKIVLF